MTNTADDFIEVYDQLAKDQSQKYLSQAASTTAPRCLTISQKDHLEDAGMMKEAIKKDPWALQFALDNMRSNEDFIMEQIAIDFNTIQFVPQKMREDPEFMLRAAQVDGRVLCHDKDGELLANEEIMKKAVRQYGPVLRFAPDQIREKTGLVKGAVANSGHAFQYASEALRSDFELAALAVSHAPSALKHAPAAMQEDRGLWLQCAPERVKHWKTTRLVRESVDREGRLLQLATDNLDKSKDVVGHAIAQNYRAFELASEKLRGDRSYVTEEAFATDYRTLRYATAELLADRELFFQLLPINGLALEFASEELRADPEIVRCALAQNGLALKYASVELQNDRPIVLEAMKQNRSALIYASKELQFDEDTWLHEGNRPPENLDELLVKMEAVCLPKEEVSDLLASMGEKERFDEAVAQVEGAEHHGPGDPPDQNLAAPGGESPP